MSRLCLTMFVGVLSRDVGLKLNLVTILNVSALYIFYKVIQELYQDISILQKYFLHP
ncbi:hypothetical protein Hanom_Chr14g01261411 [Helianthus anomalus]